MHFELCSFVTVVTIQITAWGKQIKKALLYKETFLASLPPIGNAVSNSR
jgi:hypothetical protein